MDAAILHAASWPSGPLRRSAFGVLCHVLMDLPTSYGTRPLSPFSWTWYTLDWMPIVDVYLIAILTAGLAFGSSRQSRRRRSAAVALALMAVNYGVRAAAHHSALAVAEPPGAFARQWCAQAIRPGGGLERWPLPSAIHAQQGSSEPCLIELVAIPDFLSPWKWRVIARTPADYRTADLNLAALLRGESAELSRVDLAPNEWDSRVRSAAATESAQVFLGFSRLPAVRTSTDADGVTRVRWIDLRFMRHDQDDRVPLRRSLFGATVLLDAANKPLADRLGP